jgi:hypothetical protein
MKSILMIGIFIISYNTIFCIKNVNRQFHIDNLLQNKNINIMDTENPNKNKYYYHKYLCPILHSSFPKNIYNDLSKNQIRDITDKYLTEIYVKEHFPYTYRDDVLLSITSIQAFEYMMEHCTDIVVKNNKAKVILLNCSIFMIIVITLVYYYAKFISNKTKKY